MPEPEKTDVDPDATPVVGEEKNEGVSKEEFNGLVDKISTLASEIKKSNEPDPFQEPEKDPEPDPKKSEFDRDTFVSNMTLGQLTDEINSQVDKNVSQPLLEMITQINVNEELKDLKKEPDFEEFQKETFKIAVDQPKLTMRRCYELAKSENPDLAPKGKKDEDPNGSNSTPAPKNTSGERPGVSHNAVDPNKVLSVDEAVQKAIAEEMPS